MRHLHKVFLFTCVILSLFSCENNHEAFEKKDSSVHITILYTNDEHGWMEAGDNSAGAAGLMYKWKADEGYDESDNYLILSGGDMWSGPAISTWFQGESMVEVMNAMDYDAAAIGNHEFDFTVDVLEQRLSEMTFPLLAANIVEKGTQEIPDFAKPYIIKEINGVKVGILGLASQTTPTSTFPANVTDYAFTDYAAAIERYAPEARKEGAAILIVIGHICSGEMNDLAGVAHEYGICFIGGGHCHQQYTNLNNGVVLLSAGSSMTAYGRVEFDYSVRDSTTSNFDYSIVQNTGNEADPGILDIVEYWEGETEKELSEEIAYTDVPIGRTSVEMRNMVCDSWLHTFPEADVAFTNGGGIRQDIPAGAVTLSTIVGLLPFENNILKLELTGAQVREMALAGDICMGGMTTMGGFYLTDGTEIQDGTIYEVLTTDYLYLRDDYNFSTYDPDPVNTYVHYRDPLIDWMRSIDTSPADPLANYLDYVRRR